MPNRILTLDQGTTTISQALVKDHDGKGIAVAQKEFTQVFPQSQIGVAAEAISSAGIGKTTGTLPAIPIAGSADQQAALFGQMCSQPEMSKIRIGTLMPAERFGGSRPGIHRPMLPVRLLKESPTKSPMSFLRRKRTLEFERVSYVSTAALA